MRRGVDEPVGMLGGSAAVPGRARGWLLALAVAVAGGVAAALSLDPPRALLATLWLVAVIAVVRSDLDRFIIPDEASAAIAGLGLVDAVAGAWDAGSPAVGTALLAALSGGAAAFAVFWLIARLYRRRAGREGLGFGDVKLAGASGLWLTFMQQTVALELACLAALVAVLLLGRGAAGRHDAVPFGAFLAPAAWLVFVGGPVLGRAFELAP